MPTPLSPPPSRSHHLLIALLHPCLDSASPLPCSPLPPWSYFYLPRNTLPITYLFLPIHCFRSSFYHPTFLFPRLPSVSHSFPLVIVFSYSLTLPLVSYSSSLLSRFPPSLNPPFVPFSFLVSGCFFSASIPLALTLSLSVSRNSPLHTSSLSLCLLQVTTRTLLTLPP